jgi:hypothetical protein
VQAEILGKPVRDWIWAAGGDGFSDFVEKIGAPGLVSLIKRSFSAL